MPTLPYLTNRRILVTRAAHQASKLSAGLRALGAEPVEVPVLEIRDPENSERLNAAVREAANYDWLIFTSANAVGSLHKHSRLLRLNLARSPHTQFAAIGEATADALRSKGLPVNFVPQNYNAESLIESLPVNWSGKRVLMTRSRIARDTIPDALRAAGAIVDVVDAYSNAIPNDAPENLRAALKEKLDAATFTSSSSVTHLAEAAAQAGIPFPFPGVPAISVGPVTTQTLREHNWPPAAQANPSDIPGLIAAVAEFFSR
jgi:uroporphyrinogen-III synthase